MNVFTKGMMILLSGLAWLGLDRHAPVFCAEPAPKPVSAPVKTATPNAAAGAPYQWKPDVVYRFKYHKLIRVERIPDDLPACQASWNALQATWKLNPAAKAGLFKEILAGSESPGETEVSETLGSAAMAGMGLHVDLFKRLLSGYDTDSNGKLSATEWAAAQACVTLPNPTDLTEIKGVLVIKVESVDPATGDIKAVISMDSPHLEMPPFREYDKKMYRISESSIVGDQVEQSLEELLHRIMWKVKISKEGVIQVLSREPDSLMEYAIKFARANRGKKKYASDMEKLFSRDMGLGSSGMDTELLAVMLTTTPPASGKTLEAVRPFRVFTSKEDLADHRQRWIGTRSLGTGYPMGEKIELYKLNDIEPPVTLEVTKLENTQGQAVFDTELGMLERIDEQYRVDMRLSSSDKQHKQYLDQKVSVEYKLERIQPPIRGQQAGTDE